MGNIVAIIVIVGICAVVAIAMFGQTIVSVVQANRDKAKVTASEDLPKH